MFVAVLLACLCTMRVRVYGTADARVVYGRLLCR